ncbi:MAG: TolC family protein [Polyangia bacterium]
MRLPLFVTALALSALCVATSARADRALSLDDALDLARSANRDLQAARVRIDESKVGIEQAWAALLPNVAARGTYTHNYKEVTLDFSAAAGLVPNLPTAPIVIQKAEQLDFVVQATVPLLVPWAYPALSAAKETHAANVANFQVTETGLLFQTAQAFFAAAGTDELVIARQHAIAVEQTTLSNAQARLEAGVVNKVEVMRAELALVRSQQALREAVDSQAAAYRSLATLVQLREPFHVMPEAVPAVPATSLQDQAREALKLRPEFTAFERNMASASSQASSAAWRWAPSISAFGNFRAFNYAGFSGDQYAWAVGAQLDWTLYDGGIRDAQRHLAKAQWRENDLRRSALRDTVSDDLATARSAVETKRHALDTAMQSVDLSKQTLELVRVQHDAGTATQLDLLQAQDALVTAEVSVAQARFDLALADLSLRRTAGTFPGKL